jgi:hypothetical protein
LGSALLAVIANLAESSDLSRSLAGISQNHYQWKGIFYYHELWSMASQHNRFAKNSIAKI